MEAFSRKLLLRQGITLFIMVLGVFLIQTPMYQFIWLGLCVIVALILSRLFRAEKTEENDEDDEDGDEEKQEPPLIPSEFSKKKILEEEYA